MPLVQGFIFDLDGTLADTMPAHYRAWRATSHEFGLQFTEARFYELGGVPTSRIASMLVVEAGLEVDPTVVAAHKEQTFVDSIGTPGVVLPINPVIEIARRCRSEGKVAIASGGTRALVSRTLETIGLSDWFPIVVASEDTERHKPDPDVFLEAARRMGLSPSACTVYEDTELGIEAARRAEMRWVDVRPLYERRSAG